MTQGQYFSLIAMILIAPHSNKNVALVLCAASMALGFAARLGWIA